MLNNDFYFYLVPKSYALELPTPPPPPLPLPASPPPLPPPFNLVPPPLPPATPAPTSHYNSLGALSSPPPAPTTNLLVSFFFLFSEILSILIVFFSGVSFVWSFWQFAVCLNFMGVSRLNFFFPHRRCVPHNSLVDYPTISKHTFKLPKVSILPYQSFHIVDTSCIPLAFRQLFSCVREYNINNSTLKAYIFWCRSNTTSYCS